MRLARKRVLSSDMSDQLLVHLHRRSKKLKHEIGKEKRREEVRKAWKPNHLNIKLTTTRAPHKMALLHWLYPTYVFQNGATPDPERGFDVCRVDWAQYSLILMKGRSRRRRWNP